MSNLPKDMPTIKNELHNIIKPHINYLNLEGFIVIDADKKILKVDGDDYLYIDGKDAFFYNTQSANVSLEQATHQTVVDACNAAILKYSIIEDVWNKNFVRVKDLNSLNNAELNQIKVYTKDSDFQQSALDSFIMNNTTIVTKEIVKGEDYTLFNF